MRYEVDDSPIGHDQESIVLVTSALDDRDLKVRIGDAHVKFPSGELSHVVHRHIEVSTQQDFSGSPTWVPLPEHLRDEVLKWAVDNLVGTGRDCAKRRSPEVGSPYDHNDIGV